MSRELTELEHIDAMLAHLTKAIKQQMLAEVRESIGGCDHIDECRAAVAGHLERLERLTMRWKKAARGASDRARIDTTRAIDRCFRTQHRNRSAEVEAFDSFDRLLDHQKRNKTAHWLRRQSKPVRRNFGGLTNDTARAPFWATICTSSRLHSAAALQ